MAASAILNEDARIAAMMTEAEKVNYEDDLKSPKSSDLELEELNDGIHDGLEFPTEEEKLSLRRIPDAIPWNAYSKFVSDSFPPSSCHDLLQ
jgi:proton-dependent oligopeptide transporter, POT family